MRYWGGRGWICSIPCLLLLLFPYHSLATPPQRIISLSPGLTELVYSLGVEQRLIAVTSYCDRPDAARKKPKVGGPANPSLERIVALKPDLVLLDEEGSGARLAARLQKLGIRSFTFRGARLKRLPDAIRGLGRELGAEQNGNRLAAALEGVSIPSASQKTVRTLFVIWPQPLITAGGGTILDDVMQLTGMQNVTAGSEVTYPRLSLEQVIRFNPQLIVIGQGGSLGEPVQKMLARLSALESVKNNKVCMVSDALYRPGPRIPEGVQELKDCLKLLAASKI